MNEPKLVDVLAKKENKALTSLLFIGLIGSTCVHVAAMITPLPSLWKTTSTEPEETIEVIGEVSQPDAETIPEVAKEPEPIPPTNEEVPKVEPAPEAIALAPETSIPLNEGKDAAAPDNLKPLLTTGISDTKIQQGGGSIIAKDGIGSGFGNAKSPTGFVLGGKRDGNLNGKRGGVVGGIVNGDPNGKGTQTSALPDAPNPPIESNEKRPPKLECLSCPKPQYRGKEGTPRVTYDIAPDGQVMNVRLRQSSGDPQTDRETLEAMSKWQFNPQTVPESGRTNVRVRVTFEEEGSNFQRQNEERRREAERLAEQERYRQEAEKLAAQERLQQEASSHPLQIVTPPAAPSQPKPIVDTTSPPETFVDAAPAPPKSLPALPSSPLP